MSEEKKSTENETNELDLSGLNFGPAWARSDSESGTVKKYKDRDERGGEGRPGGRNRQGGRQDDRRSGGGDRRQGGGGGRSFGGGGRDQKRGNERRDGNFSPRPRREEVPAPEGVQAKVMPVEESLDKLAKEITGSGRTYSVFDLAKFLLQARERFQVNFLREGDKFFRCAKDNSLWLSKDEALRHLWRADWLGELYTEVQTEVDAPKGSFQAVAKCGMSGEYLGPPNYHAYQSNTAKLHRERFSHMSLEDYKGKVRMEHGEEAVNAWLDSMKTVTRWTPRSAEEIAKADTESAQKERKAENKAEEAKEAEAEKPLLEDASLEKVAGETPIATSDEKNESVEKPADPTSQEETIMAKAEVTIEESEAPSSAETPEAATQAASEDATEVVEESVAKTNELLDEKEMEAHFVKNHFANVFVETDRAWVTGDIKGFLLSPGLLTLLKNTVADEKRYPGKLTPLLCRQLSGRHVAVYKWRKKLKAGPSRPHAVPEEMKLSDRPQQILDWLGEHSGKKLAVLWETVLPKDADETVKREWFHDLHWLLNQGHAIFLSNMTLHLAKKPEKEQKPATKKSGAKTKEGDKPAGKESDGKPPHAEEQQAVLTEPVAEAPKNVTALSPEASAENASVEPPKGPNEEPEDEAKQSDAAVDDKSDEAS